MFASTGLTLQYNCKKIFSIRTGLSYQQKGYRPTKTYDVAKTTLRFDYLTIPILARFTFGKKVHFFVNVGVFGSFLAGTTKRTKFYLYPKYVDNIEKGHQTNPPGYNAGDAGFTGGLGISVPIKTHWLISLEARNYSGVLDISNKHGNTFDSHYKLDLTNTSDLLLGVAYRLGLRDVK
ncbi:porin family protein [Fluviicola sp.]|uniref:porin family protein n=1 Tax=Fluviicola sp. TaxID=1917219 RepID=UPI003D273769